MANRFDQITQFINHIKPVIFAEAGITDFSLTEKLLDDCLKQSEDLVFFGLGIGSVLETYNTKLMEYKDKNPNFDYFLIDLAEEIDLEQEYFAGPDPIKLTESEIVFCNDINDVEDFLSCLKMFQSSKCIILNKVIKTDDQDLLKKSVTPLLPKIKHLVLPVTDSEFEDGDIINTQLAITGPILNSIKTNDSSIKNSNPTTNSSGNQVNIKTKNAVPNELIQKHVEENITYARMTGIKEVMPCEVHKGVAYLVGGAPSYKNNENIKMYRKAIKEPGHYLFSSKTALNHLLSNNIVPYACILLDPREHIPSYVDEVNTKVIYFVASQCNPEAVRKLHEKGAKVVLYHAAVNAGEADVVKKLGTKSPLIGGGSTSVTRGIGMLQMMGFSHFKTFGIDSSYPSKPEKVHGYNQEKPPMEVDMSDSATQSKIGKKYWTDPELIAQCNDIEMIMKNWYHIKLEDYSEGMMRDMFKYLQSNRGQFKQFMKEI